MNTSLTTNASSPFDDGITEECFTEHASSAARASRIIALLLFVGTTIYYVFLDECMEEEHGIITEKNTSGIQKVYATPVHAQSLPPSSPQENISHPVIPIDGIYVPHLPFGDDSLHYRSVCAPVGAASLLCMTLKYPFPFDLQDETKNYPFPVDDRFYEISSGVAFIDGADLKECISRRRNSKQCLDDYSPPNNNTVVGIWTRNQGSVPDNTKLYGVQISPIQGKNIDQFFNESTFVVLGASPSPGIMNCMMRLLFGRCKGIGNSIHACKRDDNRRPRRKLMHIPEGSIVVAQHSKFIPGCFPGSL
jgi:hypothetical protein